MRKIFNQLKALIINFFLKSDQFLIIKLEPLNGKANPKDGKPETWPEF